MFLSNLIFESMITQMYLSSSILYIYLRSDYKPTPDVLFSLSASTCICLGETYVTIDLTKMLGNLHRPPVYDGQLDY